MARILVIGGGTGLAGIVQRLVPTHHVATVADSATALVHVASGMRFDAIVCDVADGRALHAAMATLDADQAQRMLVLEALGAPNSNAHGPYQFLGKPFRLDQLQDALVAMLTPAPGPGADS